MSFEPCTDIRLKGFQTTPKEKLPTLEEVKENFPKRTYSLRGRGRGRRGRGCGFIGTRPASKISGNLLVSFYFYSKLTYLFQIRRLQWTVC